MRAGLSAICALAASLLAPAYGASSVLQIIQANPDFSTYLSLLQSSGLAAGLNTNGPFSVFGAFVWVYAVLRRHLPTHPRVHVAQPHLRMRCLGARGAVPTNEAFAKVPSFVVGYYNASVNANSLLGLLAYHVVTQDLQVSKFIPNQEYLTAEGDPFYVEYVHGMRWRVFVWSCVALHPARVPHCVTGTTNLGLASVTCQKSVQFVGSPSTASNGMVQGIDTVMFPQCAWRSQALSSCVCV